MRTLAAIVAAVMLAAPVPAQRVGITEYVSVVGADGTPVTGLPAQAFSATADDNALVVEDVSPAGPMAVALVLDATSSARASGSLEINAAALDTFFLTRLREGDRARVFTVSTSPAVGTDLTADQASLKLAIATALATTGTGPSPIWDAVRLAAQALASAPGPRVMVLSSDGRGTGNVYGFEDALREVVAAHVTVGVIASAATLAVEQTRGQMAIVQPDVPLRRLARDTGGAFYLGRRAATYAPGRASTPAPAKPPEAGAVLGQLMTDLQQRYALRFSVPADGKVHRLRVTVSSPDATVRAPTTFVAK